MNRKTFEIQETRDRVYARDGYKCQYPGCKICGYMSIVMAHRISKGKGNINYVINTWWISYRETITIKEAKRILNDDMNLVSSCSTHNSKFNIGNRPVERDELLKKIANKRKSC